MGVKTIFNPQEFTQFIIAHLTHQMPSFRFKHLDHTDPFQLIVIGEKQIELAKIDLHHAWEDYMQANDLNAIIHHLNIFMRIFQFKSEDFAPPTAIDVKNIYPTIRPPQFLQEQENPDQFLRDDLVPCLDTLFIEKREEHSVYLTKSLIKPLLEQWTEKEIMDLAYENLILRGWHSAKRQIASPSMFKQAGTYHIFSEADYPFQHQFFMQGIAQNHLPDTYLIAFPAKDIAVALTVENPITSLQAAKKAAIKTGFVHFIDYCYKSQPKPISQNIYWAMDGKPFRLTG